MDASAAAKFLVLAGVVLIVAGGLVFVGGRFGFFGLGRLPGDIRIEGDNVRVYIPVATSILLSVILTALLYIISRFR
jgi:hypothetical protein